MTLWGIHVVQSGATEARIHFLTVEDENSNNNHSGNVIITTE